MDTDLENLYFSSKLSKGENNMKFLVFIILLLPSMSFASWSCEGRCGLFIRKDIGGSFSYHYVSEYRPLGYAIESASSKSKAFNKLKLSCRKKGGFLHDGFVYKRNGLKTLNINIAPSKVCSKD